MIEYPSIINSSKAPRAYCVAFDKLDGSNFRAKWTAKKGFDLFGTRTQLIDENTAFWGDAVKYFKKNQAEKLEKYFKDEYRNEREVIVYGEYLGENSFAGRHDDLEPKKVVIFDVMVGHKNQYFVQPLEFVKQYQSIVEIPTVIYVGNLNDEFIKEVRENKYKLKEGVVCKGTTTNGAYRGKIWMCKIKTQEYLAKLQAIYGAKWKDYWE